MPMLPSKIAHRGASGYAPENTLPAFEIALEYGCKCFEIDVQLTKDNQPVLFHDDTMQKIFGLNSAIAEYTYDDLIKLDAGKWYSDAFAGITIMHLQDAIVFANKHDVLLNIELKTQNGNDRLIAKIVLDCLKKYSNNKRLPAISSFSINSLRVVREEEQKILLGYAIDKFPKNLTEDFALIKGDFLVAPVDLLTGYWVTKLQECCQYIYAYTVNDFQVWEKLKAQGITGVFTDKLGKLHNA